MRIEHIALNVPEPIQAVKWYVENLGMRVVRAYDKSPYIHFLVDDEGHGLIEFYHNPAAPVPDYPTMNPLNLHIAFSVEDMEGTRARLVAAGARAEGEIHRLETGDELLYLRDPWGVPLQLVKRSRPLVG